MLNSCWEVIDVRGSYYRGYCGDYCKDYYGDYWWVRVLFTDLAYYAGCPGAVGVRGDILALK